MRTSILRRDPTGAIGDALNQSESVDLFEVLPEEIGEVRILERHGTLPAVRDGAIWRVESWFVKG